MKLNRFIMHFVQLFSKHNRFTKSLFYVYLNIKSIIPKQNGTNANISYEIKCFP